jgi:hypothetical protein
MGRHTVNLEHIYPLMKRALLVIAFLGTFAAARRTTKDIMASVSPSANPVVLASKSSTITARLSSIHWGIALLMGKKALTLV